MTGFAFARYTLGVAVTIAMLADCGQTQPPVGAPASNTSQSVRRHKVFQYTGGEQTFIVPAHVTEITVLALGASGGYYTSGPPSEGPGGEVKATIPVTPDEKLYVFVGGRGGKSASGTSGGYNGGGAGGIPRVTYYWPGDGGDGASDIRQGGDGLSKRIIVAGGGGGAASGNGLGGAGGGKIGAPGGTNGSGSYASSGGGGGTQKSGGAGGAGPAGSCPGGAGESGTLGQGGGGGESCLYLTSGGGGGGGGYYGGGGGGGGGGTSSERESYGGGGGGGSSYVEKRARRVKSSQGTAPEGDGKVTIYW